MVKERLQDSFISGLILTGPLILTVLIIKVLFDWSLIIIDPLVKSTRLTMYTGNIELLAQVLAAFFVIILLTLIGVISRNKKGNALIGDIGRLANILPVFRNIYSTIRQISEAIVENDSRFKKAVLVEYPRKDIYSIGFVTGEAVEEINEKKDSELYNVFIPNSPNPTAGELKIIGDEEIEELDMSIRKALRLIMTTGISERKETF